MTSFSIVNTSENNNVNKNNNNIIRKIVDYYNIVVRYQYLSELM